MDTSKIFEIEERDGDYLIALHEFVRAIIFGDHTHYSPQASPIANVLDVSTDDGRQHFLMPLLLAYVERTGAVAQGGFVDLTHVMAFGQSLGFTPTQIEFAVSYCSRKRLLQSPGNTDQAAQTAYRITTVGAYTYKRLLATFVYVDAVVVDTPIVDEHAAAHLGEQRDVEERLQRAREFVAYLDAQWTSIGSNSLPFSWPATSQSLQEDIERAARSAARWRSPDIAPA